ncbi:hypothetical protein [Halorubrum sp. DTA46]|uniref:hypothetical protein n=1 Tax=Halorubrum sp. DTA46 TaxID=3402162 RepID=UPI003AAFAF77
MSLVTAVGTAAAVGTVALLSMLIYRDATRVGVDLGTPASWAVLVAVTGGLAVFTRVIVPDAPLPGVLVIAVLGPLLYLLERDDSMHGDDPADPTRLPSESESVDDRDE